MTFARSSLALALATVAAASLADATRAGAQQPVSKDPPATPARRPTPRKPTPTPVRRPPATSAAAPAARPAGPAPAKALADADVAFATQAGGEGGLRAALLATLADDAVLFQPRAIAGRAWAAATTLPAGQYSWAPAWSAVAADASLGVTTGPIAFHRASPDSSATGQYVTVWSRAPEGTWKALIHLVVPGPQAAVATFAPHVPAGDGRPRSGPGAMDASRATLYIADRGLAAAMKSDEPAVAISRVALPDSRILRAGALPSVGADSIRAALAAREPGARVLWQTADLRMARTGDFGVTYGVYERQDAASGRVVEAGNFVRAWERQADGGWRILLDAAAPFTR